MEYKNLGRTGLRVSRFCLGTINFSMSTTEFEVHKIIDSAVDMWIIFFNIADSYGNI